MLSPSRRSRPAALVSLAALATTVSALLAIVVPFDTGATPAFANSGIPIVGTGSTWSQKSVDVWRKEVAANHGLTVNYSGVGASAGRRDFIAQTVDFAVSELPFQSAPEDGSSPESPQSGFAYAPLVAGATSLAYNLEDASGARITSLRLSDATTAGIFTGAIRSWDDPAVVAENPGIRLPAKPITPVVRSDSSGSTWQFTNWLRHRQPELWSTMCPGSGECRDTSQFPTIEGMRAQTGSLGVAGYVSQPYGEGAITYVEHTYAMNAGLPVAKLLNASGYYVAPTPDAVSIALLGAAADADPSSRSFGELDWSGVHDNADRRAYPLSSTSYLIVPTEETMVFTSHKGASLGQFASHALCAGQRRAAELGTAPLPLNLVQHGLAQLARVPGSTPSPLAECSNPTFVAGDTVTDSRLTRTAPMPPVSDRAGDDVPSTDRVSGSDRYDAAVAVSRAAFPATAPVVFLATGATYPDALSAGPAAAIGGGPLLLTPTATLTPGVAAEIERLAPARIVIVGGSNSVSDAVLAGLRAPGRTVIRIGGADRYDASRNLARFAFGAAGASTVHVATGSNFPDALSAGAAAAAVDGPVVLVNGRSGQVDGATTELLRSLGAEQIVIAGGPSSITADLERSLATLAETTRQGGADRYEASAAINSAAFPTADRAFLATGLKYPDALAASAWAGSLRAPLYVSRPDCVPGPVLDSLREQGVRRVTLIGGTASLSPPVASLTRC